MNGLDLGLLKHCVVVPTLEALGLAQPAAINLVTGTALVETRCVYLRQLGSGPALGLWQMEPETHDDCWVNYLNFPARHALHVTIKAMLAPDLPPLTQLVTNLRYACAMTRVRYLRAPAPLPDARDAAALSAYHKRYYNTVLGAADAAANRAMFAEALTV